MTDASIRMTPNEQGALLIVSGRQRPYTYCIMLNSNDRPDAPAQGVRRLSVAHFLIALILLLATVPFVDQLPSGALIESVLVTLMLLTAVMAVGGQRQTLITAAVLATPAVVGKWIQHFQPDLAPEIFTNVISMAFMAYVTFHLFRFILRAPRVNNEVFYAAISTYLMLGLLWSFAYLLVSRLDPGAFVVSAETGRHRPMVAYQSLFLSFGTLSNVGFDDVRAASKPARMLVMAEGLTSIFYIAIIISRLVAIYTGDQSNESSAEVNRP
jgi:hypothetical protein